MIEQLLPQLQERAYIVLALWLIPLIAYFVDFWTGVEAARAQHEEINSGGFRRTIKKAGEYWRFQLMAVLIDLVGSLLPFYDLPYITMIATISIVMIEFRSVKENFKKKKSNIIDAIGLSQKIIQDVINAKDKISAIKAIIKITSNETKIN